MSSSALVHQLVKTIHEVTRNLTKKRFVLFSVISWIVPPSPAPASCPCLLAQLMSPVLLIRLYLRKSAANLFSNLVLASNLCSLRSKSSTSCFSDEICDNVRVMYSSSSRRAEMFIERATYKRLLLAPEERNRRRCCVSLPETLRSAGARVLGFTVRSINIRLLRSQVVISLRPKPRYVICG